jgi:hypothetical protein
MEGRFYNNLHSQQLSQAPDGGSGGSPVPTLIQGSDLHLSFRFVTQIDGSTQIIPRRVHSVVCTIGTPDARPASGTYRLKRTESGAESAPISHDVTAEALLTALRGLFGNDAIAEVVKIDGSWLVLCPAELVEFSVTKNLLSPNSFVRWAGEEQLDDTWLYELRLVQSPLAFTDQFRLTLPQAPAIAVVQEGDEVDDILIPEVQSLRLDPWFEGVYRLRRGSRVSADLSVDDDAETIQEALQSLLSPAEIADGAELTVSDVAVNTAHIRFGGFLAGVDEDPLEVIVVDAPPGDPTLTLDLGGAAMAAALRKGKLTTQIELTWRIYEETAAASGAEQIRELTGYRGPVTILPAVAWDGLRTHPDINWTSPPDPTDYVPFSEDNILLGTRANVLNVESAGTISWAHGLGTELLHLQLKNSAGAYIPIGAGWSAATANQTELTLTTEGLSYPCKLVAAAVNQEEHFVQGLTVTMGQVTGLNAYLTALAARVAVLEELAPTGTLSAPSDTVTEIARWPLLEVETLLPSRKPVAIPATGIADLNYEGRLGLLLPAIHTTATPGALPSPLPLAPTEEQSGKIYRNQGSARVTLSRGQWPVAPSVAVNGLVGAAWDPIAQRGYWYPVELKSGTSSYYPSQFSVTLWELIVTEQQLRAKTRFRAEFGFAAGVLRTSNRVRWQLAVEYGAPSAASTPGTPGPNLSQIVWNVDQPAVDQALYLGPNPTLHRVGIDIARAAGGELTAQKVLYGARTGTTAPAGATFAIRARLHRFDTWDGLPFPGAVAVQGLSLGTGEGDTLVGSAWIS